MGLLDTDGFEEDFLIKKQDKQKLKEEILDENFKKVSKPINKKKTQEKIKFKKKPFLKLGLFLICISIICLLIMDFVPWAYAKYDNKTSGLKNNEIFYYKDNIDNLSNDTNFSSFFESNNSSKYLGLSSHDFKPISRMQSYILLAIIALGIIFTIVEIFIKRSDFPLEKYKLFHCFFAFITALLCIYFIFITIKFIGANILVFFNANNIHNIQIENLSLIFIAPIVLLLIVSGILKTTITVLKINFNDFEKIFDEKTKNESLKIINYGAKLK